MKTLARFFIISLALSIATAPANAAFRLDLIISDVEFKDVGSMNQLDIQRFLERKGSSLADYVDPRIRVLASQLIYDNMILNGINPKVLLTTLQKEQSLVTDPSPSQGQLDWATGYGICDACSKSDPSLQKYKGFANQIDYAASSFSLFFDNPQKYGFKVGQTYKVDDKTVTVANAATSALLNYTPHEHGNENFYRIWQDWFVTTYPDGTLLQDAESGGVFLIQNNTKRPFSSRTALVTRYDPDKVVVVSPEDLEPYTEGPAIKYAQYALIRGDARGTVYLIRDDKKHGFASNEAFRKLGFNPEEVDVLPQADVNAIPEGEPITLADAYPAGGLLQDPISGGVWYVQGRMRQAIWSPELLQANFPRLTIQPASEVEIGTFRKGAPVKFRDGELVKSPGDPAVFVISNGERRPIASGEVFEKLGFKWENIIVTSAKALSLHLFGETIVIDEEDEEALLLSNLNTHI